MRNYFLAISTAFAAIYSPSIFAASGCVVIDGKTYELNLASMPIDPDVDVGTVLYTARVDTSGPKLTCPLNTARGKYSSQMLGSFQTLVGTNAYGNIYASAVGFRPIPTLKSLSSRSARSASRSLRSRWRRSPSATCCLICSIPRGVSIWKSSRSSFYYRRHYFT